MSSVLLFWLCMIVVIKIEGSVDGQSMLHKREKWGMRTAFWPKSYEGHVPFVDSIPLRVNQWIVQDDWASFAVGLCLTNLHSTNELLPVVFISWRSSLVEHNGIRRITSCRRTIGLFFCGNIFFVGQYCPSSPESWTENERWNNCVSCAGMRWEVELVAGRWIGGLRRSVCLVSCSLNVRRSQDTACGSWYWHCV